MWDFPTNRPQITRRPRRPLPPCPANWPWCPRQKKNNQGQNGRALFSPLAIVLCYCQMNIERPNWDPIKYVGLFLENKNVNIVLIESSVIKKYRRIEDTLQFQLLFMFYRGESLKLPWCPNTWPRCPSEWDIVKATVAVPQK